MRRLTARAALARIRHRRLSDERGAIAVVVAVAMVALLGFTAISIDVGAMYAERAQLQSGADAAAIAIAQDCAAGRECTVAAAKPLAQTFANANTNDGAANVADPVFPDSHSVTVTTSTKEAGTGAGGLGLFFAPLLGVEAPTLTAQATASWGSPARGPAVLPLAFAPCSFNPDGSIQVLRVHGSEGESCTSTSPSGQALPGGFGWIDDPTGTCTATVDIAELAPSKTGVSLPSASCADVLAARKGSTVILPVYGDKGDTGSGGWYKITGWAAFTLLGWHFTGGVSDSNTTYNQAKCTGNCKGLIGRFVEFVSLDDRFTPGGPDLGTTNVWLSK